MWKLQKTALMAVQWWKKRNTPVFGGENQTLSNNPQNTEENKWIIDYGKFEIYEFFYEQEMNDYFKANTVFEKDLKDEYEYKHGNVYTGVVGSADIWNREKDKLRIPLVKQYIKEKK